jgi:hypothetical protein
MPLFFFFPAAPGRAQHRKVVGTMFGGKLLPLMPAVSASKFGVVVRGAATPQVLHLVR